MNISRQARRAMDRGKQKVKQAGKTVAWVLAFEFNHNGSLKTLGCDVQCECSRVFRFSQVPLKDWERDLSKIGGYDENPATTGDWVYGACPGCGRSHRVRATVVVTVEEEDLTKPVDNPTPEA